MIQNCCWFYRLYSYLWYGLESKLFAPQDVGDHPMSDTLQLIKPAIRCTRSFEVHVEGNKCLTDTLNNDLPQGSVLAPLLINLYVSDLSATSADDTTTQKLRTNIEPRSQHNGRLIPNPSKTEVIVFRLNNQQATQSLDVKFVVRALKNNTFLKCLRVRLGYP